jgi:hypothetical protein
MSRNLCILYSYKADDQALHKHGPSVDDAPLPHLLPLGGEHITLTGDDIRPQNKQV